MQLPLSMASYGLQACLSIQRCLLLVELLVLQIDFLRLCLQLSYLLQTGWQNIRAALQSYTQSQHSFEQLQTACCAATTACMAQIAEAVGICRDRGQLFMSVGQRCDKNLVGSSKLHDAHAGSAPPYRLLCLPLLAQSLQLCLLHAHTAFLLDTPVR